jgi:hypothetical protein
MKFKKLNLTFIFVMFIFPFIPLWGQTPSSPDCRHSVNIDYAFSNFFKQAAWHHRKVLPKPTYEGLLYWLVFQEELTESYGYLEDPPVELILQNQLCHMLSSKKRNSIELENPIFVSWLQIRGQTLVTQLETQSLKSRKSLISKHNLTSDMQKELKSMAIYLSGIKQKIKKEHF